MRFASLRWKLSVLIAGCVVLPVGLVAIYFPTTRIAALEAALTTKAISFVHIAVDQTRSAIAFDDGTTASEVFEGIATDPEVTFVGLFREDGTLIRALGTSTPRNLIWSDQLLTFRSKDHVRVVAPVVSREGPRGMVVLELSTARALKEGADALAMAIALGLLALAFGCAAAWLVGRSFGRRVARVQGEAARVASGDLAEVTVVDDSRDEIGQLARAFQSMVQQVRKAHAGIEQEVVDRTEALRASREQYRALVETTEAVPWELEPAPWRFTYVGPQALKLMGVSTEQWCDVSSWQEHIPAEDRALLFSILSKAANERTEQTVEFRVQRGDGRYLFVRMLISAAGAPSNTSLRGFMFDVTQRAQMELELRQAQKLESVGRLASGIAHEINTPLQFVSDSLHFVRESFGEVAGVLQQYRLLCEQLPESDAESRTRLADLQRAQEDLDLDYLVGNIPTALDRAVEGLGRVTTIVRSMKEFAHQGQKDKAPADINKALQTTLIIARNEYKDVADVRTSFGPLPETICHIGELNQAFLNIIVNAAQAITDASQGATRGLITITTRQEGGDAVVEIADTGGGISPENAVRMFEPFFTTKEVGRGTGQGLAIARRSIVEHHKGALTFETAVGVGTTFAIRIPFRGPAASAVTV